MILYFRENIFQRNLTEAVDYYTLYNTFSFALTFCLYFSHRPPFKLVSGGRSRPHSGSQSQRSGSGNHVKSSLTHLPSTVSPMVRGKLSERASRIRARRPSALETSDDSDDDTSSDSSDD